MEAHNKHYNPKNEDYSNNEKQIKLNEQGSEFNPINKPASSSKKDSDKKGACMEKSIRNYAKVFLEAEELIHNEINYEKKAFAAYDITGKE